MPVLSVQSKSSADDCVIPHIVPLSAASSNEHFHSYCEAGVAAVVVVVVVVVVGFRVVVVVVVGFPVGFRVVGCAVVGPCVVIRVVVVVFGKTAKCLMFSLIPRIQCTIKQKIQKNHQFFL